VNERKTRSPSHRKARATSEVVSAAPKRLDETEGGREFAITEKKMGSDPAQREKTCSKKGKLRKVQGQKENSHPVGCVRSQGGGAHLRKHEEKIGENKQFVKRTLCGGRGWVLIRREAAQAEGLVLRRVEKKSRRPKNVHLTNDVELGAFSEQ